MNPEELSAQLRHGHGGYLSQRRAATGLTLAAMGTLGVISLYQLGVIAHVPEPPLPLMKPDEINGAPEGYALLNMPDGVLGLGSYAVTLGLIAMGGKDRAREHPWLPLALAGKAVVDSVNAGRLSWDQWSKHRGFCLWCLGTTAATLSTLPLVVPEARSAWRRLRAGA